MKTSDCFKIGYVAKTHGLKGEVTLVLSPGCPDIENLKTVFIEHDNQLVPYFLEGVSVKGTRAFVKFEDVNSSETAAGLKGCSLFLSKSDRPKLTRGEFYSDEVLGFEVIDADKGSLGLVDDVIENGASRFLSVIHDKKEIMIPVHGPFIRGINKTRGKIDVELPEGFLDI